ncbi:CBS domain-containing protein [Chloroflexota bacterium]
MDEKSMIRYWMKTDVFSVELDTTIKEAASKLVDRRVGTLPIVEEDGTLVGVSSISEIIDVFLPDFVDLLSDVSFVTDFGELGKLASDDLERAEQMTVNDIMQKPVAVEETSSLIRSLSIIHQQELRDLLVVKDGKLVGIASEVDISCAFLTGWISSPCE